MSIPEIAWSHSFPDDLEREDYTAWDGDRKVGRVYRLVTGAGDRWAWFPGWPTSTDLPKDSRREAMLAIEDAYAKLLQQHPDPGSLFR